MDKAEAIEQIESEVEFVKAQVAVQPPPSGEARLYTLLADLTDDDAALTEMEDLGWPQLGIDDAEGSDK